MPQTPVPLPTGIAAVEDFPRSTERLVNLMNIGNNEIVNRPGVVLHTNGSGQCRGATLYRGRLFHASGSNLMIISEDPDIAPLAVGGLPGTGLVIFARGHTGMVILEVGGGFYQWTDDGSDGGVFTILDSDQFRVSVDIAFMDGRWYYCPADGSPIFYSEVGFPANIGPTNFFDAEISPDNNKGLINYRNTLFVFGDELIERFRTSGDAIAVAIRVTGGQIDTGYIAGRVEYNSSFAYIGRDQNGHAQVMQAGEGRSEVISTAAIDDILNEELTLTDLRLVQVSQFVWRGRKVLLYTFPKLSLAFNGIGWVRLTSAPVEDEIAWFPNCITFAYGQYYCGDLENTRIGRLDLVDTEYGLQIEHQIDTFVRVPPDTQMIVRALELRIKTGVAVDPNFGGTDTDWNVGLSISRDGTVWGPTFYRPIGAVGHYADRVQWRLPGGLGKYESFMGIRITTAAPLKFATDSLWVDAK